MGTRGAIGFRWVNHDKVTYNHYDSYPTGHGVDVFETVRNHTDQELAHAAATIVLVDEEHAPTPEQCERYRALHDPNVSTGAMTEWYSLLRNAQGTLEPYVVGSMEHMIDNHAFLADSLFCEWAYIVNCDTREVEVYRGFNEAPGALGRYAKLRDGEGKYYGVALLETVSFDVVRSWADKLVTEIRMERIEKSVYGSET